MRKSLIISIIIVIALFIASFYFYTVLPNTIITHWNAAGQPNGYMPKLLGNFLIPITTALLLLLLVFLPKLDPLKKNYKKFITYYDSFILIFTLFMSFIYIISTLWNLGIQIPINSTILPAVGFLFIYIGIILRYVKQNWFIGIKTPWTLSNKKVWDKTHQLGSTLFIISGIIVIGGVLFPPQYLILFILVPILLSAIFLFIYSYILYKKTIH